MSPRTRWVVAVLVGTLALAACEDAFFYPPATDTSVPVRLSWTLAPEVANLATPQQDFDNADKADVLIEGGGRVLFDQVVPISRASNGVDKVAQVEVHVGEDESVQATIDVKLLVGGSAVLQGTGGITISGGEVSGGSVNGTYELSSVAGFPVPATFPDAEGPGCDLHIESGRTVLSSDGTFSLVLDAHQVPRTGETPGCGVDLSESVAGTYQVSGETVLLTIEGETVPGALSGNTLALVDPDDGLTFNFQRSGNSVEIFLAPIGGGTATVTGTVVNALNDSPVANATVDLVSGLDATGGSPIASTTTDAAGGFSFVGIPAGGYTLVVTASGFIQSRSNVSVGEGQTVNRRVALSEQLGTGQTRVVLTWGGSPLDLDAHITGPDGLGGQAHVYFGDRGSQTSAPFLTLDTDDQDGHGPETITIWQQFSGTYCYSVDNFSESPDLSTSQATVEVFQGNQRVATFSVPQGTGLLWTVFRLDAGGVTPVNRMESVEPPGVCP